MDRKKNKNYTFRDFGNTVKDDIQNPDLFSTIKKDFQELKEFYLDEDRKERLAYMGKVRQTLHIIFWTLTSLFYKLSAVRRLILIIGIIFVFVERSGNGNSAIGVIGFLFILFVLMLELKDKLVAKDELEAGRKVQLSLMPEEEPSVPGWSIWLYTRPANDVGGDLIDFLPLSKKEFAISLGDVSGKGLGAALLMAKLQAIMRAVADVRSSVAKFGEKVNSIFHRDIASNSFASLAYMRIMEHSGEIKLLNAGQMPPLIKRGDKIEELEKGDVALGLLPKAEYKDRRHTLNRDDIIILYSDGITEAENSEGEFFGRERFFKVLSNCDQKDVKAIGERITNVVLNFKGEAKAHDDISLAILKFEE